MLSAISDWLTTGIIWRQTIILTNSYPTVILNEVLACYSFDKDLKALLFKAIQTIEVAVRSKIIKHFAPTCGPFWFMDSTKAVNQRRFQANLDTIKKEVGRSKERYIREHFHKYSSRPAACLENAGGDFIG